MTNRINAGDAVGIRCDVKPGPFSGEHLIQVETLDGPVSGFVTEDALKHADGQWWVAGIVLNVFDDHIEVRLRGSFFTTNGIANISSQLAMVA
jgi:hypothetical protein